MQFRKFLLRKIIYLAITFFLIVSFNFLLFRVLPGDPTRVLFPRGEPQGVNESLRDELYHKWGLDQPLYVQYGRYLFQLVQGDLGISMTYRPGHSVTEIIGLKFWRTLVLVGIATVASIYLGLMVGIFGATRHGRKSDVASHVGSIVCYSIPTFWIGMVFIVLFTTSAFFPVFRAPPETAHTPPEDLLGLLAFKAEFLILPVATFVVESFAAYALIMRNSLTDVLTEDYVVTARAKGLTRRRMLKQHAIPNAMLPVVTIVAFNIGWVIGGTIVVEEVFTYDGLGKLTFDAVFDKDIVLMQALFLIFAVAMLVANFVADLLYAYLDPRVKV